MNGQISRLAVFALALLGALIVATTYWQSWAAPGLANRKENAIQVVAQFTIERGKIADVVMLDADPLQDIKNIRKIRMVMKDGVIIDRDRLPTNPIIYKRHQP